MKGKRWIWGIGVLLYASLMVTGAGVWWLSWGPGATSGTGAPEDLQAPLDPAAVARGERIYQASCAQCHGAGGEGQPDWKQRNADGTFPAPPHDSSGHTWHHADGLLFRIVRDGGKVYEDAGFKSMMPAFGDNLSDEEIIAVISYLKSLWDPKKRAFQAQVSLQDPLPAKASRRENQ